MTIKELKRLRDIRNLLAREEERLQMLHAKMVSVGMNFSGLPHSESPDVHRMEDEVAEVMETEERIEEYKTEKRRIENYINSIDDLHMRYILSLRFIDQMSWRKIARKLGGGNTEDSVKKCCYRFLEKN